MNKVSIFVLSRCSSKSAIFQMIVTVIYYKALVDYILPIYNPTIFPQQTSGPIGKDYEYIELQSILFF